MAADAGIFSGFIRLKSSATERLVKTGMPGQRSLVAVGLAKSLK